MENNEDAKAKQDYQSSGDSNFGTLLMKGRFQRSIQDYEVPSNVKYEDGTQDSTSRKIFLKASSSMANYMVSNNIEDVCLANLDIVDDNINQSDVDIDSFNREWILNYRVVSRLQTISLMLT
jgi:hypothetical protein